VVTQEAKPTLGSLQAARKDRIAPVPERKREAEPLLLVREGSQAVFAPVVSARPRRRSASPYPVTIDFSLGPTGPPSQALSRVRRRPSHAFSGLRPSLPTRNDRTQHAGIGGLRKWRNRSAAHVLVVADLGANALPNDNFLAEGVDARAAVRAPAQGGFAGIWKKPKPSIK